MFSCSASFSYLHAWGFAVIPPLVWDLFMNSSSSLLLFPSSASHRYSSEVRFGHLSPISPFRVQHVLALHFLSARRGGGHGMAAGTYIYSTYMEANINRCLAVHSEIYTEHSFGVEWINTSLCLWAGAAGLCWAAFSQTLLPAVLQRLQGPRHHHVWGESSFNL